jgi:hypothetical protein
MGNVTIDLGTYQSNGVKVFSGRPSGKAVRQRSGLVIPADTFDVNPSFLEELIREVVAQIGGNAFIKKFRLDSKPEKRFMDDVHEAIGRIDLSYSPLSYLF